MPHHRTLRNSAWALANRALTGLSLLAAHVIFARVLQPAETGRYHLAVFVGMLAATLATFGLPGAATRFIAADIGAGGRVAGAIARRVGASALAGLCFVSAVGALAMTLGPASWRVASLGAMIGFCAAQSVRLVAAGIAQGYADFRGQAVASLLTALILPAGATVVWIYGGDASDALGVTAVHAAATGTLVLLGLRSRLNTGAPLPRELAGRIARYCAGVAAILVLDTIVWQQSEAVFLRVYSAPIQLGLYSVAYSLVVQTMQFVPGSIGAASFPALAAVAGAQDHRALVSTLDRTTRFLAVAAFPIASLGTVLARDILAALYGQAFAPAAPALQWLWIGGAAGASAVAASGALYALNRERLLLAIAIPLAAFNIGLDLLLIPHAHAVGAAAANTVTQLLGALAALWAADRVLGGRAIPWWSMLRIAGAACAAGAAALWTRSGQTGWTSILTAAAVFALAYSAALALFGELRHARLRLGKSMSTVDPGAWRS